MKKSMIFMMSFMRMMDRKNMVDIIVIMRETVMDTIKPDMIKERSIR
jgi:hypothetical protein